VSTMSATYRNRQVQVNQIIFDQVDLFQSDGFNRISGLLPTDVSFALFLDNQVGNWPLVDGTTVFDGQVAGGSVYWAVLPNGSYGIRFFPSSIGHWTLTFSFAPTPQIVTIDYDVVNIGQGTDPGFRASFC
jgi:hypothetical protein